MFDESDRVPLERNDENDRGQMIVKGFGQGVRLNARKRLLTKSWQESNREETGFLDSWQRKQRRRNEISSLLAGRDNTGFRITAKRVEKSSKRIHSQCSRWNIQRYVLVAVWVLRRLLPPPPKTLADINYNESFMWHIQLIIFDKLRAVFLTLLPWFDFIIDVPTIIITTVDPMRESATSSCCSICHS